MESVTNKMLLQRARKVKVTWCIVRAVWWMLRHFQPNCCKQADICQVVWGFRTKWPSSWPSEEASWRSQMPNWWRSARGLLTVFPFTKPRILWWRYTFTDHVVTDALTFRVTVRRSSLFFSFLVTNVILNKTLSNKQIITTYPYFPI